MKNLIFLLFFVLPFCVYAQFDTGLKIRLSPITMLDDTPRLRAGFEYSNQSKWHYGLDVGIGNSVLNKTRLKDMKWGNDYSFFEIRPEIKYVYRTSTSFLLYCSAELFYLQMTDHLLSGEFQKDKQRVFVTYDEADFKKQKTGMHLKTGADFNLFKRFYFDVYGGIGFANRTIAYANVVNPIENEGILFVEWGPKPHLFEGQDLILHFTAGFRISYLLWKNKN
ncbi:MAG: hypothetical protein JW735_03280 [Prolixibacteraceae bacterium]|nr:hypothetical protein [Prolixibacteraceae bacterium]